MADELSVQLLFVYFGSRAFAYQCITQGLNRSLSGSSSVVRKYLDPVLKTDRCPQYEDDIGVAAHTTSELIETLTVCSNKFKKQT